MLTAREKKISQRNKMQMLQTVLSDTDKQLASDSQNTELVQYREKVKHDLEMHAIHEAKSVQIRSRIKLIEDGEKNKNKKT